MISHLCTYFKRGTSTVDIVSPPQNGGIRGPRFNSNLVALIDGQSPGAHKDAAVSILYQAFKEEASVAHFPRDHYQVYAMPSHRSDTLRPPTTGAEHGDALAARAISQ